MGNIDSLERNNNVHLPDWSRYCHTCRNTGTISQHYICENCDGQGQVIDKHYQQKGGMCSYYENTKSCYYCNGSGECKTVEQCKDC